TSSPNSHESSFRGGTLDHEKQSAPDLRERSGASRRLRSLLRPSAASAAPLTRSVVSPLFSEEFATRRCRFGLSDLSAPFMVGTGNFVEMNLIKMLATTEQTSDALQKSRCYGCFRPQNDCFCAEIPTIDNKTHVLILQHMRERFHPFNT